MGAILAVLANPVVSKLAGKIIGKVFDRKGKNAPVINKVKASATAGAIVSIVLAALGFFFGPELVGALQHAGVENLVTVLVTAVGTVVVFIQTLVAYYQRDEV